MFAKAVLLGWSKNLSDLNKSFRDYNFRSMRDAILLCDLGPQKAATVDEKTRQAIWDHLKRDGTDFRQFGVYNLPYCGVMAVRARAVQAYIAAHGEEHFLDESVPMHVLEEMSAHFALYKDTTVYPVKAFVMSSGRQDEYAGFHPNTSPCRQATEFLVGDEFKGDHFGHMNFCRDLAKEMGITPTDANTLLYLIGMGLRG